MTSRKHFCTRRYRMRAPTSEVDETLQGSDQCGNSETVQIITRDLIRNLRIPSKVPPGQSTVLPLAEFERIKLASQVLTKEGKEARKKAHQMDKKEDVKATVDWKRRLLDADLSRKENQALTELDLEARDRNQHLLERASMLKLEQDEEIKKLNQLIVNAQCKATWDVQIQEKKQIQEKLSEEEKRLDTMMEVERRKALQTEEQIEELRKQKRISGMQQIYDQIQKRLVDKEEQEAMKMYESKLAQEKHEKMKQEDLKNLEKTREEHRRLQEEIVRVNAELVRAKEQRREEEKLADMKQMEYIRNKQEQAAKYQAEQRRIKKEKDLLVATLTVQQKKATDYKAEQDALRARRHQENAEREWRRKEGELAAKKAQEEATLRAARVEQARWKEHMQAMEAFQQRAEFERELKVQQEEVLRQKEEEERQRQRAHSHAEAIRRHMSDRQLSAIAQRREMFKEANRLVEEDRQRRARLSEIKVKKLRQLRATGLPEKYCCEVEKKASATLIQSQLGPK